MKIALLSSFVPFVNGGARNIVEWLQDMLIKEGVEVDRIYLPQSDDPNLLIPQMAAWRQLDLDKADKVICFRPPAYAIYHEKKILWFIHHFRSFYDLWDTPYRGFKDSEAARSLRANLIDLDTKLIQESHHVFTNSKVVSNRIKQFNGLDSEVLYPPVIDPHRFYCGEQSNTVVYICRIEHHKRQHLLIQAMAHVKTPVKLAIYGVSFDSNYISQLEHLISTNNLRSKVRLENRWITEEEKVKLFANSLAAAYLPLDEDSYGYPSIEASHSRKAILTTTDSGGVIELVEDGHNGYVTEPTPQAIAEALDKFYMDKINTLQMGVNAESRLKDLNISWSHVLDRLLNC